MSQTIFTYESIFSEAVAQLVTLSLPEGGPYSYSEISFGDGPRELDNVVIAPLAGVSGFSRVEFKIRVPFNVTIVTIADNQEKIVDGSIPDIQARIVLYAPLARQEPAPTLAVSTSCHLLVPPSITGFILQFVVNVNIVVRLTAKHQLRIPSMFVTKESGDAPDIMASWADACEKFVDPARTQFPGDFFPKQFKNRE